MLAASRDQAMEVAAHQLEPFVESRLGAGLAGASPAVELAEDERVGQCPAADRDGRAAGFLKGRGGFGDRPDVAVGDDRNSLDGFDDRPDAQRDSPCP